MALTANQREEMKQVAEEVSEVTVQKAMTVFEKEVVPLVMDRMLQSLGIDTDDLPSVQADNQFTRKSRLKAEKNAEQWSTMWFRVIGTVVGAMIVGTLAYYEFSIGFREEKPETEVSSNIEGKSS